ncbi:MAG: pirin, partial [Frankiales bacterium]|nr:pirin [Frankiales bacterium]
LPIEPGHEHGVLVDTGKVNFAGTDLSHADLGYRPTGSASLALANSTDQPARVVLIGGTPFDEDIVMWWNFVGRTHAEIAEARATWESGDRFGTVSGGGDPLPAPPMPPVTLKPRGRA